MNRVRVRIARRSRVYTIRTTALLALLAVLAGAAADAKVPPGLTIEPSMVKGPATAPVTIVEFSDYQ